MGLNELEESGSLTNTQRRRVVPAPHGSGHAGDVGVALEESGTGVGQLPPPTQRYAQPRTGGLFRGCVREQDADRGPLWGGE